MHEELVHRLRGIAEDRLSVSDSVHGPLMQAADLIDAQAQEISKLLATRRWNIQRDGDALLICEGYHGRDEGCTMRRWLPADGKNTDDRDQSCCSNLTNHDAILGPTCTLNADETSHG